VAGVGFVAGAALAHAAARPQAGHDGRRTARRGRRRRGIARRQHGPHTSGATGDGAVHGEHVGGVVVLDRAAADFVGQGGTAVAAQLGAAQEPHHIRLAVVFDDFGLAFDEFVRTFALLAEKRAFAGFGGDGAELVALGVLTGFKPRAAHHDGALGEVDAPGKDTDLFLVVVAQGVGLDVHGLVAVGALGMHRRAPQGTDQQQRREE
jgi:hypothetical protein